MEEEEYKILEEHSEESPLQAMPVILVRNPSDYQPKRPEVTDKEIQLLANITMCDVVAEFDKARSILNDVISRLYSDKDIDELNTKAAERVMALVNEYKSVPQIIALCANLMFALEQIYVGKISCREIEKCQWKSISTEPAQETPDRQE